MLMCISLWLLSNFFLVTSFQKFDYNVSCHRFLWVSPTSWTCELMSLTRFGGFWPLFLWILFQSPSPSLLLWDSNDTYVASFVIVSDWVTSIELCQIHWLYPLSSPSTKKSIQWFLNFYCCVFYALSFLFVSSTSLLICFSNLISNVFQENL